MELSYSSVFSSHCIFYHFFATERFHERKVFIKGIFLSFEVLTHRQLHYFSSKTGLSERGRKKAVDNFPSEVTARLGLERAWAQIRKARA